jgi:ATP-dependent Clp protease ATP-binding subunit ClpA
MFERYTEKARRVIFFARYEASEFGSPYIETEFLLLGMLREDKFVVKRWLGNGAWTPVLREEIAKLYTGPKTSTSVDLPLTEESKRALAYAAEEADRLKHPHINTEHLLLGLMRDRKSLAAKFLLDRGVSQDLIREALAKEGTQPPLLGARAAGSRVEVEIVPEKGEAQRIDWQQRIPATGEFLTLEDEMRRPTCYQVVRVEWKVTTHPMESPFLAKASIHVREFSLGYHADAI